MRRIVSEKLLAWKNSNRRKPLIVRGARQVGKTYSIKELGEKHFAGLIAVDLEKRRNLHGIFGDDLTISKILSRLEMELDRKITPGKDLLFFDEIQCCSRAIMALRYFYEDLPALHVVAAGSMLEFALSEISFPVGRVQFLEMVPMTFLEYLWALGRDPAAAKVAEGPKRLDDFVHAQLLAELRNYGFVGGMPEAVRVYAQTGSFKAVSEIQQEISDSFRQDFSKYKPHVDVYCLDEVFKSTAQRMGQQIKYSDLAKDFSPPTVKKAFDALTKARVFTRVPTASPAGLPLGGSGLSRRFKALLLDVGLWQHLSGLSPEEYDKPELLDVYRGALAEQLVGQELVAQQSCGVYYWTREAKSSQAEVDYLVASGGSIYPLEVKSGASGRLRSLHLLLKEYPHCPWGIVFSSAPYAELPGQRIKFVPVYYAGNFV